MCWGRRGPFREFKLKIITIIWRLILQNIMRKVNKQFILFGLLAIEHFNSLFFRMEIRVFVFINGAFYKD